ncbi:phage tail domain-containing protein [Leuconostoc citreum]|uniref:phage tail domain-containing protein n=1 Tax=Leuconostoc citreum TaxID=33964 RepID=UPI0015DB8272
MFTIEPRFLLKIKGQDEFDITDKIPKVIYLGGDSTPVFNNSYQENPTRDGSRLTRVNFGKLIFTANFLLTSQDYYDQKLLRHDIYQLFGDRNLVRIRTDIDMGKVMFARPSPFDIKFIENGNNDSLFSILFEIPSGYKYSLERSDSKKLDYLSFGMNLTSNEISYNHSENSFKIFNPSDITIDPYYQRHDLMLIINFDGDSYKIENITNNTSYQYNERAKKSDNIVLNGISTILNGNPASQKTDFGYIKLEKGWNDIKVSGATSHTTTFSFPFIFID